MRTLAIDAAGAALSAAALDGAAVRARRHERLERGQAERILPLVGEVVREAGWSWREIGLLVVTLGPGSFTGVRSGVAAARALALAAGIATLGVSTLEALAAAVPADADGLPLACVLDGRRAGSVFCQRFSAAGEPLDAPAALMPEAVADLLDRPYRLAGSGVALLAPWLGPEHRRLEVEADAVAAAGAAARRLAEGALPGPGSTLVPLYLRAPDARPGAGAALFAASA
ncbi:MAG TPA: tRNA (adenosine(37)-N6)-threonylcarbamoyltransferase complex dimerization subunit type 1 TsaB [Geminicoccaceae bacterium]|nr:tRNA (adenosine(37)-N6)-threonylcarbamoyltransferase complex dimerization subunit type 1 TsaB [Geminicoccaceae bacterium]